jgi:hypothetical protein
MRLWLKWETMDIAALLEAVEAKSDLESRRSQIISKKTTKQKDLEKLKAGKSSIKTLFKS